MSSITPISDSDFDKLTYEIFSILENKFLLDYTNKQPPKPPAGKVRLLSIDAAGSTAGLLAAKSLTHLESSLRRNSGNSNAQIADYFDVVAGSGAGGLLAALLFTRGKNGTPIFTAKQALTFMSENRRKNRGPLRRLFRRAQHDAVLRTVFGEATLRNDTLKAVLIPCYNLATSAQLLLSRADALEMDGCDFKMSDVCAATLAEDRAVEMRSVDGRTRIVAVGGGVAMSNPTAAAITHVMNNKQEFPTCNRVEDLFVLSLGNGESDVGQGNLRSPAGFVKIAGDGASDMVDQAVSMAFGSSRANYVRIQVNSVMAKRNGTSEMMAKLNNNKNKSSEMLSIAEEMLAQKNVESILFEGKTLTDNTNVQKLHNFGQQLVKEHEARKTCILPTVSLKPGSPSPPRTSSSTTLSTISSSSSASP